MDPFGDYEVKQESTEVDPAADFLAREQAELAKIDNNAFGNDFDNFGLTPSSVQEAQLTDEPNFSAFDSNSNNDFSSVPAHLNSNQDVYRSISSVDRMTQEPEKIKRWREDQKSRIEAKDVEEEVRKRELRDAAKHELEEWYRQRSDQLIKNKETNKQLTENEQNFNSEAANSQKVAEWDRIAKHCEFNPKANRNTKDVSRFRSLLLQLKQQPLIK